MAHAIDETTGIAAAWSNELTSWHGLGSVTTGINTSEDIIKLAGLDFEVVKKPIFVEDDTDLFETSYTKIEGHFSTVRTDTHKPLGIVGKKYEVIPNTEAFRFFDSVIGKDNVQYETAGALKDGRVIYVTAKMKEPMLINGKDPHDMYVVFTNSHDGSSSVRAFITSVRIVCANTFAAAIANMKGRKKSGESNYLTVRHLSGYQNQMAQAMQVLALTEKVTQEQQGLFEQLQKIKLKDDQTKQLALQLICDQAELNILGTGADVQNVLSARKFNTYNRILESCFGPASQQDILGTAYGFMNGVTYYTSHVKDKESQDATIYNHLFGTSRELQSKAVQLVTSLV
ncbi:hypothetical protein GCM10028806_33550 [Spirosoma terrae]|uniref:DUF932 domain-containing protein n=1 Tax=Spirosoma terrae TaxID=1968276 RepID=A0A6L9L5K4_9BACT|nr:DUF932 domain-containing protein [Spirosoma terrae]NDU95670.1 DUF932 domain-containing protein [Spirosoma terrae]